MRHTRPVVGKILEHTEGMGVPSADTIRRRARELALIDGRTESNEEDFHRAFQELHGGHPEDESETAALSFSEREMMATTLGSQIARSSLEGDDSVGAELVAEGMDEAAHDSMLAARREIDLPDGVGEERG